MLHFSPFKMIAIGLFCLAAAVFALPNLFSKETVATWPNFLPQNQVSLGLDLRGGAHLLLSMDTDELREDMLTSLREDVRAALRKARIGVGATAIRGNAVQVRLAKPDDEAKALEALEDLVEPLSTTMLVGTNDTNITVAKTDDGLIALTLTDAALRKRVTDAIGAAIETVRRRVDPTGNVDASITRNGTERILLTGVLEFSVSDADGLDGVTQPLTVDLVAERTPGGQAPLRLAVTRSRFLRNSR